MKMAFFDCWGFVMAILAEMYGVVVPDYSDAGVMAGVHGIKQAFKIAGDNGFKEVKIPRAGLVVLMRGENGLPCHCGALIDNDMILHIDESSGVMFQSRAYLNNKIISMWGTDEV